MLNLEILGIAGLVVSLMSVAISNFLLNKTNKSAHDWNRRKAAQDIAVAYTKLNPNRQLLKDFLSKKKHGVAFGINELQKEFKTTPKLEFAISDALNYHEYLCLGIKQGVYDEELIKSFWGASIILNFHRFREFILIRRRIVSPTLWEVLEEYVNKWENQSTSHTARRVTG